MHQKDLMNSLSAQRYKQNHTQYSLSEEVICLENVFLFFQICHELSAKYLTQNASLLSNRSSAGDLNNVDLEHKEEESEFCLWHTL